jgi:hypothetical protein
MSKVHLGNPATGRPTCGKCWASYGTHNLNKVTCQRCGAIAKTKGYNVTCDCMIEPDALGAYEVAIHSSSCRHFLGY